MNGLAPLIELASQKSLDLFFRVGQGYVAQTMRGPAGHSVGHGLSPIGVQSRAAAGIVCTLAQSPRGGVLHAWPGGRHQRPAAPVPR